MCGRLTLKTAPAEWGQLLLPALDFEQLAGDWQPRYNIAPTQDILVIARGPQPPSESSGRAGEGPAEKSAEKSAEGDAADESALRFGWFRWGLVPSWSGDMSIGNRMINARHETLREKKSFIGPLRQRRCLIVADGYYEWQQLNSRVKQPHWIAPADGGMLQLAGLWEVNRRATGQPLATCTIITTAATSALSSLHDRMPVVLAGEAARRWMAADCDADEAYAQLGTAADTADALVPQPVSSYVNNARHEGAECLTPA